MSNLTVNIPHQLGREEARRRVEQHLSQSKQQYGSVLEQMDDRWTGDTLYLSIRAMGQSLSGVLYIEEQVVRVEIPLPWPFALLAGKVQKTIEHEGRKLLEPPKPT